MTRKQWFTVIGVCEEQRHANHVKADSAEEAEDIVKERHDRKSSYTLTVAGVAKGKIQMVDDDPAL